MGCRNENEKERKIRSRELGMSESNLRTSRESRLRVKGEAGPGEDVLGKKKTIILHNRAVEPQGASSRFLY